ncbi:MAG: DUF3703 domain-containing protein [Sphingomonas sp.]
MDCAQEMMLARSAYAAGDLIEARRHFGRAHGACHDDKRLHLSAHWGLARVALRRGNLAAALNHIALLTLAAIFD